MKIQKPITVNPHDMARKVVSGDLKNAVDKAISVAGDEYRISYKKLLDSKKGPGGVARFRRTESEVATFLDHVYDNLPFVFKDMINRAVEEQTRINKLTGEHQQELKRELANIIDQEIRLKGKFV